MEQNNKSRQTAIILVLLLLNSCTNKQDDYFFKVEYFPDKSIKHIINYTLNNDTVIFEDKKYYKNGNPDVWIFYSYMDTTVMKFYESGSLKEYSILSRNMETKKIFYFLENGRLKSFIYLKKGKNQFVIEYFENGQIAGIGKRISESIEISRNYKNNHIWCISYIENDSIVKKRTFYTEKGEIEKVEYDIR